jgi:aspartate carbamoyltransferase catalytic subunit
MRPTEKSSVRHLVDALDFSRDEYLSLISLARDIMHEPARWQDVCAGKLMVTVFYEPSTRTRLSFEAAMQRLGGRVLTVADPATSSAAKGESLADAIRTVCGYADVVVLRHPKEGAARLAALYSSVPLINAGDGAREHPTQTLTDLCTIQSLKGQVRDLSVALCGDLKYGRTVHSLIKALALFPEIGLVLVSPPELRLPDGVKDQVKALNPRMTWTETADLEAGLAHADVLYMTRIQRERFFNEEDYLRLRDAYALTPEKLGQAKPDLIVMHPLPRVVEIHPAVDGDPRAAYFQQARFGMFVRMALLCQLLEVRPC